MALGLSPQEIIDQGKYPLLIKADHWLRVPLSEVVRVQNGFAFKSTYFNRDTGMPLIRIRDITKGETEHKFSGDFDSNYIVREGDILIGMDGDFLAAIWTGKEALLNQRVCKLKVINREYDKKFFFLCIQPYLNAINAETSSVTVKHLSSKTIEDIPLPLPPLSEQRRIVHKIGTLFSELDNGIEALKTAQDQLKVYRQALLKHAFEGKLTAHWREENQGKLETPDQLLIRIPAPIQPRGGREASVEVIEGVAAMSVNKPMREPPLGWAWTPLLRVARQETGHTPSRKYPEYWGGDQYWVGIVDARHHHGKYIHDTIQKVTQAGLANSSARTLPAGTVCLSRTASVGYVCLMSKPMATSQDFATWTCTEALKPKFLMYALMAEGMEIKRFGKGTTHTTIYFPEIRALHICLPSLKEQEVIVQSVESKLQQVDSIQMEIDIQLARSETLRQSILKKAFSGQLVPQDPSDEPAETLLERIRSENEIRLYPSKTSKGRHRKLAGKSREKRNATLQPG